MKPLLKWVGGKTQLLNEVLQEIPDNISGTYHEPFVGGGSVLLAVLERSRPRGGVVASDANGTLIDLWRQVRDDPESLWQQVSQMVGELAQLEEETQKKEWFYNLRNSFNADRTPAKFLVLNKTCFRGLWREGPSGFNVPYGNYKKPEVLNRQHLMDVHRLIQGVDFRNQGWQESLAAVQKNDWVYMDPPYCETFTGYTRGAWSPEDHQDLFTAVRGLSSGWVMSNSDTQPVQVGLGGHGVWRVVEAKRAINSKNPGEKANEVLITRSQG